jgi:phosphoribosylformimino-5-aminoimidazole carboxamide ribonucleotide (ProFAR) isomerase
MQAGKKPLGCCCMHELGYAQAGVGLGSCGAFSAGGRRSRRAECTRTIKAKYPGFLLVSGYVRSAADAEALFRAGAHMVGIAAPTREEADYIYRVAEAFKAR